VGDSGESDPEVYGALARRFPVQVRRILIHEVTNDPGSKERYAAAFQDVPENVWTVFRKAAEIEDVLR
jgi:phosphatidate phosphatase APP1